MFAKSYSSTSGLLQLCLAFLSVLLDFILSRLTNRWLMHRVMKGADHSNAFLKLGRITGCSTSVKLLIVIEASCVRWILHWWWQLSPCFYEFPRSWGLRRWSESMEHSCTSGIWTLQAGLSERERSSSSCYDSKTIWFELFQSKMSIAFNYSPSTSKWAHRKDHSIANRKLLPSGALIESGRAAGSRPNWCNSVRCLRGRRSTCDPQWLRGEANRRGSWSHRRWLGCTLPGLDR